MYLVLHMPQLVEKGERKNEENSKPQKKGFKQYLSFSFLSLAPSIWFLYVYKRLVALIGREGCFKSP